MFKNNLKIAWRNLVKNGVSSFINIGGLAAGMAVAILIGLWIYDELSFNKSFQNYDRIGIVMTKWKLANGANASQPTAMGLELAAKYQHDFKSVVLSTQPDDHVISFGGKKFKQQGRFMQPAGAELFSLNMIRGSRAGLNEPNSILLGHRWPKSCSAATIP